MLKIPNMHHNYLHKQHYEIYLEQNLFKKFLLIVKLLHIVCKPNLMRELDHGVSKLNAWKCKCYFKYSENKPLIFSTDVRLPQSMQRSMAAEAEASREARAKVIAAEGEQKASRQLKEAADVIAQSPIALQLRYLQTLTQIAAEKNSTIIFPVPGSFNVFRFLISYFLSI